MYRLTWTELFIDVMNRPTRFCHFSSLSLGITALALSLARVSGADLPALNPIGGAARSELADNGPVYCGTVLNKVWPASAAMKGIVVKLGTTDSDYVCYDEDLLRVSAWWTGAFVNVPNRGRERIEHPQPAEVAGITRFGTRVGPGWSHSGQWEDPRPAKQGPLPKTWGHYRGVYLHEQHVVLSYTVSGVSVLEMPDLEVNGETKGLTRTLQIGPSSEPLALLVAESDTPKAPLASFSKIPSESPDALVPNPAPADASDATVAVLYTRAEELTAIRMVEGPSKAQWVVQDGNRILLQLPASATGTRVKLLHWTGTRPSWKQFQALVSASPKAADLEALTHGGKARWSTTVETAGTVGTNAGAYQLDTLGEPVPNPWNTKNYLSAIDFFPDGRAAVSAFHGDVWIVSGLDDKLNHIRWKRFATGLFQPLGLKIVDGVIYVTCRDALIRLHDLNGDGEADFYENFNNDTVVTANYHEFCLDLATDSSGNFYYAKGAPWPPDVKSPHQGTMLKVSKDGSHLEVIATGLRAPNGMAVGPHDEITFSDNEGHYIPTSKISLVKPGNLFYGMAQTAHRPATMEYEQPFCWLPKGIDNSSGGQVWVTSSKWGPLKDQMLFLSYGKATLFSVLQESVNGKLQGGTVPFPFRFPTGVMRARFNPADGQLYIVGLRGWQTAGVRDGGLFRVRYTGQPFYWPLTFHAKANGVEIEFSDAFSEDSVRDIANWGVEQWNYIYSENYGSPEVSTTDPRVKTHEQVEVKSVQVSDGGKRVFLEIPAIKPVMQMKIRMKANAKDGAPVSRDLYLTIHALAGK